MLGLWYYNLQGTFVDYYATSLLCDENRGPTRAADGGDASAKKLGKVSNMARLAGWRSEWGPMV